MNNLNGLKILGTFIAAFALQVSVASWISIFGVSPDLIVVFVVIVAMKFGPAAGCFWGFMAGFSQDVYQPVEWLGAHTIAFTVLGFTVGQVEEKLLSLNLPAKIGVLGLGFFICDMIYFGITGLERDVVTNLFLTKSVPECIYTLFVGSILFYLNRGKKIRHV